VGARKLVVDVNASSRNSAMPPEGEVRLRESLPEGWDMYVVRALTTSEGDGPPRPSDEVMEAIVDAEVYFGFGIPLLLFQEARKLRWVHSAAAGVVSSLHEPMRSSDVILTNSAGVHAIPIAEYAVAGILHFLRGLDFVVDQQHKAEWDKSEFVRVGAPLREMDTVRALIVGVRGIGGAVATRLSALGARCTGVRRHVSGDVPAGFDGMIGVDAIDDALTGHDVVVLAAPLTPETNGLLSAARMDRLSPSSIIVNVSRGALLDEEALAERLADGRLRGAVLDVFQHEPLATTSALWQLRNAIVSPHISPVSPGRFWPRQLDLFLDNWERYRRGARLRNVVDKEGGY
jgi:phosphoglycerate dehydrogenase-like enzyme